MKLNEIQQIAEIREKYPEALEYIKDIIHSKPDVEDINALYVPTFDNNDEVDGMINLRLPASEG